MKNINNFVKIDKWVKEILCDPLDKSKLLFLNEKIISKYGREYIIRNGICDLRCLPNKCTKDSVEWINNQTDYEKWNETVFKNDNISNFVQERDSLNEVYSKIDLNGSVLDVGGGVGLLRWFKSKGKYLIVDPYIDVFRGNVFTKKMLEAYPFLINKVNFICGDAEFLPIKAMSFDIVHMRSCVDHFYNPEQALTEAYRVLKANGRLIIGTSLIEEVNENKNVGFINSFINKILINPENSEKIKDHHSWHPTKEKLTSLINNNGFNINTHIYQKEYDGRVIYIVCNKKKQYVVTR